LDPSLNWVHHKTNILDLIQYVYVGANTIIDKAFLLFSHNNNKFITFNYKISQIQNDFGAELRNYDEKISTVNSIFFSNVFAVMGLRSLFFFLSNLMGLFRFLPTGLGVLLSFVGIKMLAHSYLEQIGFGTLSSLGVIIGILSSSIILSLIFPIKEEVANE
jgi:hypothetical protein